jgi:hypothetical protein
MSHPRPERAAPAPRPAADLAALLAAVAAVALLAAALSAGPRAAAFPADRLPPATGLYELELRPDGRPARWTQRSAALSLPNPGGPVRLSLLLAGGRDAEALLSGPVAAPLPLELRPRRYQLLLPPQRGERIALGLSGPTFYTPDDPRRKTALLLDAGVRGGGVAPPALLVAAALSAAALYASARTAAGPWPAAAAAAALAGGLLAWQRLAIWPWQPFGPVGATAALSAAAAALCLPVARVAGERLRQAAPARWTPGGLALAGAALAAYLALALFNHLNVHPRLDSDLLIYLRAGETVRAGESPYAVFGLAVIGASFFYPPATLPLFAAIAGLPYPAVAALWLVGSAVLYAFALLAIYAALPGPPSRGAAAALIVLGLGYGPALEGLAVGQINSLMLLGLALFILGHRDRRLAWFGDAALAAVILIKLTPGVLLLWPLARGDWRRLLRVAAAGALLCVPSLLLYGLGPWLEFVGLIPELLRGVTRNAYNQSVVNVLTALSAPGSWLEGAAAWVGRAVSLLLLGVWAAICLRRRADAAGPALAFGVAVLTVASSLIWYHHLTFLTVPLAWLGLAGGRRERAAALAALGLIQVTRLVELGLGVPPVTAVLGYLLVSATLALWLLGPGKGAKTA